MSAPNPSAAQAIVGVAAVSAGVAAAAIIKPEELIDCAISKVANVVVAAGYSAEDHSTPKQRGFLESKLRGLSKFVDQNALALQWKVRVMEFDEQSPVKSTVIVQCIVGLVAFALAKKAGQIALR